MAARSSPEPTLPQVREQLRTLADTETAAFLQRFFQTGPGGYGEGDRFLGIRVPVLRRVARQFRGLSLPEIAELLRSPWHEERLLALLLLVQAYARGDADRRDEIHGLSLSHTRFVNNWDLVDLSAEHIVGSHLEGKDLALLDQLARSNLLWERRIAVLATFYFIKRGEFGPTLRIAELLLGDSHDLIHKAVGWMLREVGKRDQATEEAFLREHHRAMPRTMLRYAIERFPEPLRQCYLAGQA